MSKQHLLDAKVTECVALIINVFCELNLLSTSGKNNRRMGKVSAKE